MQYVIYQNNMVKKLETFEEALWEWYKEMILFLKWAKKLYMAEMGFSKYFDKSSEKGV